MVYTSCQSCYSRPYRHDTRKMFNILDLANEVLRCILKYLSPLDLAIASQTCRRLRDICFIDDLWRRHCIQDFRVTEIGQSWSIETFREFYTLVLYKYGCILGLWSNTSNLYGILINIRIDQDVGSIVVEQCQAPLSPNITLPIIRRSLLAIQLREKSLIVECLENQKESECHLEILIEKTTSTFKASTIQFVCKNFRHVHKNNQIIKSLHKENKPTLFSPLELPLGISKPLFKAGIFKGTYSAHGIELIWVRQSSADRITATKITGDPNVPAGKVTFEVDLTRPIVGSVEAIKQSKQQDPQYPLELPSDVTPEFDGYPSKIMASFSGRGQIAYSGFRMAQWTPCHFVLFNQDMLGNIWLELGAFGVFSRATEDYLQLV